MQDNFTGKPVTMASLRKSVYPSPIWTAQLLNGERLRLSFNCPDKTSKEEMIARARFQAADFVKWRGSPVPSGQVQRRQPYPRGMRIIRVYQEDRRYPGRRILAGENVDPWQDYSAASFKRPRTTVKQVKAILADMLGLVNGAGHTPAAKAMIERAEQLLAA